MMEALKRLRRKLEVMSEDFRKTNNSRKHDVEEMLALLEIIEREMPDGRKALQSKIDYEHG